MRQMWNEHFQSSKNNTNIEKMRKWQRVLPRDDNITCLMYILLLKIFDETNLLVKSISWMEINWNYKGTKTFADLRNISTHFDWIAMKLWVVDYDIICWQHWLTSFFYSITVQLYYTVHVLWHFLKKNLWLWLHVGCQWKTLCSY